MDMFHFTEFEKLKYVKHTIDIEITLHKEKNHKGMRMKTWYNKTWSVKLDHDF